MSTIRPRPCAVCSTPTIERGAVARRDHRWYSEAEIEHFQSDEGEANFGLYPPTYSPLCPECVGKPGQPSPRPRPRPRPTTPATAAPARTKGIRITTDIRVAAEPTVRYRVTIAATGAGATREAALSAAWQTAIDAATKQTTFLYPETR